MVTQSAPQYVQPPDDPALAVLTQQNQQQQTLAMQDHAETATARLMQTYGTRIATAGNTNWSPLIAASAPAAPMMPTPQSVAIGPSGVI